MRLGILGLFSIWMSLVAASGPSPGEVPVETGDTADSGWYDTAGDTAVTDTGDTGDTDTGDTDYKDTGDTADTAKTWDTGDTGDTAETWDTADTAYTTTDTGWTDGSSASELAGEEGGFGCSTVSSHGGLSVLLVGLLLGLRRRRD
ncbi:MAG: MYXO-CTERM domain-containing protein [Myxococcota bacterium]|jgi:MYXO-CTERM domain-containing protein